MLNQSLLFKQLKVTLYNGLFSLSTTFKTQLQPHSFFQQEIAWRPHEQPALQPPQNITQLEEQTHRLREDQTVTSSLSVWVREILLEGRWCYLGCPNALCRKAASPCISCPSCGTFTGDCQLRYSLDVELADFTGSLSLTAFEEVAATFMNHISIDHLAALSEVDRKAEANRYCFLNYQVRVTTKKDKEGRIRHSVLGLPERVDCQQAIASNLGQIEQLMKDITQ
jgi:hypothetical protein